MWVEMPAPTKAFLQARVLAELIRYDLLFALRGLGGVRPIRLRRSGRQQERAEIGSAICEALRSVAPFLAVRFMPLSVRDVLVDNGRASK